MNHLKRLQNEFRSYIFAFVLLGNVLIIAGYMVAREIIHLDIISSFIVLVVLAIAVAGCITICISNVVLVPVKALWQAILHVSRGASSEPAPDLESIQYGKELVSALVLQVYDLASSAQLMPASAHAATVTAAPTTPPSTSLSPDNLLQALPIPILVFDKSLQLAALNSQAAEYLGQAASDLKGKPLADVAHFSFDSTLTLEAWLQESVANSATAHKQWNRVKLPARSMGDSTTTPKFDLAAAYSKDNPAGSELVLALFDQSEHYAIEDNAASYVAMAVHELRTPLTVLRGYIEALEEEMGASLTPELQEFMRKMSASAQTLTAFVSNILNVARIDEGQLILSLHEENWNTILPEVCKDLELRAKVRGKHLVYDIEPNLPTVAVDKVSVYEVVSNLVDNAIKYSPNAKEIVVHAHLGKDGRVETVVQDHGIGLPGSAMNNLYTKFYRSHRSRNQVGGSGLGLYLVKAIITAHGGNVWATSTEGEGSSFGFSLIAYADLAQEQKDTGGNHIQHHAHGWIKNHAMNRQ